MSALNHACSGREVTENYPSVPPEPSREESTYDSTSTEQQLSSLQNDKVKMWFPHTFKTISSACTERYQEIEKITFTLLKFLSMLDVGGCHIRFISIHDL